MTFALTVPGTDTALAEHNGELVADGLSFGVVSEGIWDLVRDERRPLLDQFARDYATVRHAEDREMTPAELQTLPVVRSDHPLAPMWQQRAVSHQRFKRAIADFVAGQVVDIGAGCGWLAADLARHGWQAAAIDITVDGGDGLASANYHGVDLLLARAEMEALPFASSSIDLAVLNASLHYATSTSAALDEAARVLRPGGSLVVLDSPVFEDPSAGHAMVAEFASKTSDTLGVDAATHLGSGFVSKSEIADFDFTSVDSSGLRSRVHQWLGRRRAGRETAASPLLIKTIGTKR